MESSFWWKMAAARPASMPLVVEQFQKILYFCLRRRWR